MASVSLYDVNCFAKNTKYRIVVYNIGYKYWTEILRNVDRLSDSCVHKLDINIGLKFNEMLTGSAEISAVTHSNYHIVLFDC